MIYAIASLSVLFVGFLFRDLIQEQTRLRRVPVRAISRVEIRRRRRTF